MDGPGQSTSFLHTALWLHRALWSRTEYLYILVQIASAGKITYFTTDMVIGLYDFFMFGIPLCLLKQVY